MKKILAVAIASAFAAPAFAATSNVDVYGVAAVSVDYVDGGSCTVGCGDNFTSKDAERRGRVSSNTSFIGFKGSEDLGGGLSAVWQIEQSVSLDQGAGTSAPGGWATGRNSFAGLSSKSLGSLTFGNQDTPFKIATGKLDVFGGGQYLADYRSLFGAVNGASTNNGSVRATNSALYTSPSWGGFTVRALGAAQQENGSTIAPGLASLSGTYENGPLFVTLAHERNRYGANGQISSAGGVAINNANAINYQKAWRAGVGYGFGNTKLGVAYERIGVDIDRVGAGVFTVNGVAKAATVASISDTRKVWYASASHKMGNTTLKAAYTRAGGFADVNGSNAQQYSLGANYALSKRTEMFGLYTQVKNGVNANYSLGGGATGIHAVETAATGQDPRGISLGMIHKF